jgi:hypothetical protein
MFMLIIDIAKKGISRFCLYDKYRTFTKHKVTMMIVIISKILTRDRIGHL